MRHYLQVTVPDEKELYIVGDIHGNARLWDLTKKEFGITDNDVVFSLGDIVDRGKNNSKLLFEFLFQDNRYVINGNHESMLVDGLTNREWYHCHMSNGGDKLYEELGHTGVEFFAQYLKDLPMIIEIHYRGMKIGLVHGCCPLRYTDWNEFLTDSSTLSPKIVEECIWSRNDFDYAKQNNTYHSPRISNIDYVISGHSPVFDPLIYGNRWWIDSQFSTGDLTVVQPNSGKLRYFRREKDAYSFDRKRGY